MCVYCHIPRQNLSRWIWRKKFGLRTTLRRVPFWSLIEPEIRHNTSLGVLPFFIHVLLKSVDNVFCPGMLSFWIYPSQKGSIGSFWTCIICFICFVLFLSKFSPLLVFHDIKIRALPRKRGNCCRDSFGVMRKVLLFQFSGFFLQNKGLFFFFFSSIYKIIFPF